MSLEDFLERFRSKALVESIRKRLGWHESEVRRRLSIYFNEVSVGLEVATEGLGAEARILGEEGVPRFTAAADDVVSLRVYVTVPPQVAQSLTRESYDIRFTMTDDNSEDAVTHDAVFRAPGE